MFNIAILDEKVSLDPSNINSNKYNKINTMLTSRYKNKISGQINGYIIDVIDIKNISDGVINDLTSYIMYDVKYVATTFTPIIGSKIDITITHSNNLGIWGILELLPVSNIECFIPKDYIKNYKYNDNEWHSDNGIIGINSIINVNIIQFKLDTNKIIILCTLS